MGLNKPLRVGLVLLAMGTGPLFLYVLFGPRDGNPVGLGLLFFFTAPAAFGFLFWGGKSWLLARRKGAPPASSGQGHRDDWG